MSLWSTCKHLFHPHRSNNHRARILHPEVIGILSLVLIAFVSSLSVLSQVSPRVGLALGFASSITPTQVLEQTNQERVAQGVSPLQLNPQLSAAALAKGQNMFDGQYWAHTSPEGVTPWFFIKQAGYTYQVAGENLARDFADTEAMIDAWMASSTHRANIMNDRYQDIGIAVIDGTLQGYETTLVVQMFGRPRAVAAEPQTGTGQTITIEPSADAQTETQSVLAQTVPLEAQASPAVLASVLVPQGEITLPPLFTPLQIIKAVFLGLIIMIVLTLMYDSFVIGNHAAMRLVGKNLAHLMLFIIVAFLLISFKGGILG